MYNIYIYICIYIYYVYNIICYKWRGQGKQHQTSILEPVDVAHPTREEHAVLDGTPMFVESIAVMYNVIYIYTCMI